MPGKTNSSCPNITPISMQANLGHFILFLPTTRVECKYAKLQGALGMKLFNLHQPPRLSWQGQGRPTERNMLYWVGLTQIPSAALYCSF